MSGRLLGMDLSKSTTNAPSTDTTRLALRMLCKGCCHISIVVAFRMDRRKRFEYATCRHVFSVFFFFFLMENGGEKSTLSKIYGHLWTASHFGCAIAHGRSDSAVSIRLPLNCDMFRFQYWGPYETTMTRMITRLLILTKVPRSSLLRRGSKGHGAS